jgi:hypothetical protein
MQVVIHQQRETVAVTEQQMELLDVAAVVVAQVQQVLHHLPLKVLVVMVVMDSLLLSLVRQYTMLAVVVVVLGHQ